MVTAPTTDHRGSTDSELLEALQAREPLALAEAYHRTVNATHAVVRRLLGTSAGDDVEAVLHQLYMTLWHTPPVQQPLEGWLRGRAFALAVEHLRRHGRSAATPSTAALLPDLGAAEPRALEPGEQVLAGMEEAVRLAFVRSHDQGIPTADQEDPDAEVALNRALEMLAGDHDDPADGDRKREVVPQLADWSLGLVAPARAEEIVAEMADRPSWSARARVLRRGRRRLEGLPPHPDMGQRILVAILADDREGSDVAIRTPRLVDLTDEGDANEGEDARSGDDPVDDLAVEEAPEADSQHRRRRGGGGLLTRLRGGMLLALALCFLPAPRYTAWRR